jgi:hypothetical protein
MNHILTQCEIIGQDKAWSLAQSMWERRGLKWSKPTIGMIIACGIVSLPENRDPDTTDPNAIRVRSITEEKTKTKKDRANERLYKILISETARSVWAIRCRRVIDLPETPDTDEVVEKKWRARLNGRLELDIALTNKRRFKKKAVSSQVVRDTWRHLVQDEDAKDWIKKGGVLVGSEPNLDNIVERPRGYDWDGNGRGGDEEDDEDDEEMRGGENTPDEAALNDDHG